MGTQRPVVIGEESIDETGGPTADHHGKKSANRGSATSGKVNKKKNVEEKIKEEKYKKNKKAEEVKESDVEEQVGVSSEGQEAEGEEEPKKKVKVGKAKIRSKKYKEVKSLIDRKNIYPFEEAIELVKKTNLTKFDGNVELHLRILSKTGKPEAQRGTLKYPHSTGRKIDVIILDDKKIEEIEKTKKIDFDIALATPTMMPRVAKLAKILGPKGKMPNPKSGTVTDNPEKTKKELEEGMTEYKTDSYGIIHQVIGKVSGEPKKLEENFRVLLAVLPKEKIVSAYLCATMGPSIKVAVK